VQKIKLRNIKIEDKLTLYKWSNIKSIRNNSLNKNKISLYEHEKWFNRKIRSKKDIIKIIKISNNDIGLVRLEKKRKFYYLSYLILPKFRRKGYGFNSIKKFLKLIKQDSKILKIMANVNKNNYASIKIFKKLNFIVKNVRLNIITFLYSI